MQKYTKQTELMAIVVKYRCAVVKRTPGLKTPARVSFNKMANMCSVFRSREIIPSLISLGSIPLTFEWAFFFFLMNLGTQICDNYGATCDLGTPPTHPTTTTAATTTMKTLPAPKKPVQKSRGNTSQTDQSGNYFS